MAIASTFSLTQKTVKQLAEISREKEKPRSVLIREWIAEKHSLMKAEKKAEMAEQ